MPLTFFSFPILFVRVSKAVINKYAASGHPCLTPLRILKIIHELYIIQNSRFNIVIQCYYVANINVAKRSTF